MKTIGKGTCAVYLIGLVSGFAFYLSVAVTVIIDFSQLNKLVAFLFSGIYFIIIFGCVFLAMANIGFIILVIRNLKERMNRSYCILVIVFSWIWFILNVLLPFILVPTRGYFTIFSFMLEMSFELILLVYGVSAFLICIPPVIGYSIRKTLD